MKKTRNPKLRPSNPLKDIPGRIMICDECNEPGGTLKKTADGKYIHYPGCYKKDAEELNIQGGQPSKEMVDKMKELKEEKDESRVEVK